MQQHQRHLSFVPALMLGLGLLLAGGLARGEPDTQVDATIRYLIDRVAGSELTFVRNDTPYTPDRAAGHMEKKYRHYRDDIDTPEDFIELCASRSLMSGEPYRVIDHNGNERLTGDWLRSVLAETRGHGQ
jgi:hypothetical protein